MKGATHGPHVRDSAAVVALGCQIVSGARRSAGPDSCHLERYLEESAAYVLRFRGDGSGAAVGPGSYGVAEVRIPKDGKTMSVTYFAE
ncbi:MAG: hypothetical protein ACREOQ_14600 [Gemmatimonadales bacterium]